MLLSREDIRRPTRKKSRQFRSRIWWRKKPSEQRREDSKYSSTLRVHASRISRAYQTRDWQDSASQKHSFWSRKLTYLTRKFRQPQLKSKIQKRLWVVYQSGGWVWPSRIWVFARAYKTRGFSIWASRIWKLNGFRFFFVAHMKTQAELEISGRWPSNGYSRQYNVKLGARRRV